MYIVRVAYDMASEPEEIECTGFRSAATLWLEMAAVAWDVEVCRRDRDGRMTVISD